VCVCVCGKYHVRQALERKRGRKVFDERVQIFEQAGRVEEARTHGLGRKRIVHDGKEEPQSDDDSTGRGRASLFLRDRRNWDVAKRQLELPGSVPRKHTKILAGK